VKPCKKGLHRYDELKYKRCPKCQIDRANKYYQDNASKICELARNRYASDPKKYRSHQRKWAYGITRDQWEEMFEAQGRRCAICKSKTSKSSNDWHTDHCHATKEVRGILCQPCNHFLGKAKDDLYYLRSVIVYLIKYKAPRVKSASL
jgi:recombination endonuclease VII